MKRLAAAGLLALALTGCAITPSATSAPAAKQTPSSTTEFDLLNGSWEELSSFQQATLCEFFSDSPRTAWEAFSKGDGSATISKEAFVAFMIVSCD